MSLRNKLRNNIYMIGSEKNQILGSKLPSNKQVLQVLFYNMRCVKLSLRESARLVVCETVIFWQKARIPFRESHHCITKLEALYNEWRSLQKHAKRKNQSHEQKEHNFKEKLDDLFDIAHANAMELIKIEEDRQFLVSQRQKGRIGVLGPIDKRTAKKEERVLKRLSAEEERRKKFKEDTEMSKKMDLEDEESFSDSVENEIASEDEKADILCPTNEPGPSKAMKRGNINFINTKLVAALDKCKLSDRDSVHILMAASDALGHNTDDLVINRTSIRRCRQKLRAERALVLKEKHMTLHSENFAVVHWDGKLLPAITGKEKVDRLPVIVYAIGQEHLLGVPQLASSTGEDMAAAIYNLLSEYHLLNTVGALCCDTTASNTGRIKGACVLLEQKLGKDLLYLPCRHHIYELVLKSAFEVCIATSSGPDAGLFKRFQKAWTNIDISNYATGMDDQLVVNSIGKELEIILDFAKKQIVEKQIRNDYKELLQLVVTFLGGYEAKTIKFRAPGAFHHARWMAKAIYSLKIFIFRNEFTLSQQELQGLRDICLFIVKIYIKAWYNAPLACKAPSQDLTFLKDLYFYKEINEKVSQATSKKFCGHLWYLTEETVALAFFDETIPDEEKIKMAKAFQEKESNYCDFKRLNLHLEEITEFTYKELHNFVSKSTSNFFKRLKISSDFITQDPAIWTSLQDYQHGLTVVQNLTVVNDTAERGVKFIEEYNNLITQDEEQKQYLLQIVKDYRGHFPSCSKQSLSKKY